MKFGPVPVERAVACVLAHSLRLPECVLKKGRVLSADDVIVLQAAGVQQVVVVQLHADDVPEDQAAAQLAAALCGEQARCTTATTGRANLLAMAPGLVLLQSPPVPPPPSRHLRQAASAGARHALAALQARALAPSAPWRAPSSTAPASKASAPRRQRTCCGCRRASRPATI